MRSMFSIVFVALFSLAGAGIAAEASHAPMLLAQATKAPPACLEKCEKAKTDCMAQYTKSDSTSGRYVTPEGVGICMSAYRECKKNCQR